MSGISRSRPPQAPKSAASWRDALKIHPAADLFPLMSADGQRVLGEDIKENGLRIPVTLWKAEKHFPPELLDGRNRLDGLEAAGFTLTVENVGTDTDPQIRLWMRQSPKHMRTPIETVEVRGDRPGGDPYAYALSANFNRRHLTDKDRDDAIAKLLKVDPTKSNRQIAKIVERSHPYIAKVRERLEKAGDVETVSTSIDTKGRKQPSRKPGKPWSRERWVNKRAEAIERNRKNAELAVAATKNIAAARDDIGPASASELARLNTCIGDLQTENRRLTHENAALRPELNETKSELTKIETELAEIIAAQTDDDAPVSACDGEDTDLIDAYVQRGCNNDEVPDIPEPTEPIAGAAS